ncbi:MAG TPA: matrixin family metalloprotease [Bryobacteraceae bacterium]|nr:matrixin family metalloprotease [Bryobacteraceae bacterium]
MTKAGLVLLAVCATVPAATLRYWVAPCSDASSGCHAADPELAVWALEAWQAASSGNLTFEKASDRDKAHIRILWTGGRDGLYGEARPILVDGVRGAEVYVLPSTDPSGDKDALLRDAIVYLTCLHETGHALGLPHTDRFADIMYSFQYGGDIGEYFGRYRRQITSRSDIRKHSGMSADDRKQLLELYH